MLSLPSHILLLRHMTQTPLFNTAGATHLPPGLETLPGGTMTSAVCGHQIITLQICGRGTGHQSTGQRLAGLALPAVPVGGRDWMRWTRQVHKWAVQLKMEGEEKLQGPPPTGSVLSRRPKCGGNTRESDQMAMAASTAQMSKADRFLSRHIRFPTVPFGSVPLSVNKAFLAPFCISSWRPFLANVIVLHAWGGAEELVGFS